MDKTVMEQVMLWLENVAQQFNDGGTYMWVLLFVFAVGMAVTIERLFFYFVTCRDMDASKAGAVAKAIESKNSKSQIAELSKKRDPLSGLMSVALDRYNSDASIEDIQEGIDEEAVSQIPRLGERLNYLALIANVATLLGLLGTIAGLQDSFASLASLEAAEKAASLAKGIAKAMNTTAFGLIVAIPHMVAYTFLSSRQKKLMKNLDDAMLRLINFMSKQRAAK